MCMASLQACCSHTPTGPTDQLQNALCPMCTAVPYLFRHHVHAGKPLQHRRMAMLARVMTTMTATQMTALQEAGGQATAGQLVQRPHPAARGESAGRLQQQPAARTQTPHPALARRGAGPGSQRVGYPTCDMVTWDCYWVRHVVLCCASSCSSDPVHELH